MKTSRASLFGGVAAIAATFVVFVIPFLFIILMAFKDKQQSALRDFSWPNGFHLWDNLYEVMKTRNWMMITAFINSTLITVVSVTLLIVLAAMVGFCSRAARPSGTA